MNIPQPWWNKPVAGPLCPLLPPKKSRNDHPSIDPYNIFTTESTWARFRCSCGFFNCSDGVHSLQGITNICRVTKKDGLLRYRGFLFQAVLVWLGFSAEKKEIWLVVSTHLKNIRQIGSFPQVGVEMKNIWNHQPEMVVCTSHGAPQKLEKVLRCWKCQAMDSPNSHFCHDFWATDRQLTGERWPLIRSSKT